MGGTIPNPLRPPLPQDWGFVTPNQNSIDIISGLTDEATDFKGGRYIHRVNPNKSPLKISDKRERGRIQVLSKAFKYPLLSHERVKPRT